MFSFILIGFVLPTVCAVVFHLVYRNDPTFLFDWPAPIRILAAVILLAVPTTLVLFY